MKLSVVFFVVLVASACADDAEEAHKKQMKAIEQKCLTEAATTPEEINKCHKESKKCPKTDCFDSCCMREHGLINKDGTMNKKLIEQYEAALTQHGHPKTAKAMKKCFVDSAEPNRKFCDVAPAVHKCMEGEPLDSQAP